MRRYRADLPLWEELADGLGEEEAIMELGCGTGRVTLHLAERGAYLVIGLERDKELVEAVWERGHGTTGDAEFADVREFNFPSTPFGLILAPMQLIQLLESEGDRIRCLSCVAAHLTPGGRAAFAIVEEPPPAPEGASPRFPTCARSKAGSTRACRSSRWSAASRSSCGACARP